MKTSLLMVVPCILLGGLLWGAYELQSIAPTESTCTIGKCPLSLHAGDAGKTFFYHTSTRFTVYLNENKNPESELRCIPEGIIDRIPSAPQAEGPMYAASFETLSAGTCVLRSADFSATIVIE